MATPSVCEQPPKQRHGVFARRFLDLVIPPKIKQPKPNLLDTQCLAMLFYSELSEISEILPNQLYLSGCSPVTSENLESLGIGAIVCALSEQEEKRMMADRELPDHIERIFVRLLDTDSSDISAHFERAGQFVDDQLRNGNRVLVHCAAGISRSCSLVLSYLMRYHNYDLRKAFNLVKNIRRVVRPNNGFFQYLIDYECRLMGSDREPSVHMVMQPTDDENAMPTVEPKLIPDVLLEHAKRVEMNGWRHLG